MSGRDRPAKVVMASCAQGTATTMAECHIVGSVLSDQGMAG